MAFWYNEIFNQQSRFGLKSTAKLFEGNSEFQKIEVLDTIAFGRVLAIDEIFMTSEKDEHFYHEMLVHPALTTAPRIDRVLVIGGGDGGTVREVLSYPEVQQVTMVEIDPLVVEVSQRFLPTIGTAWEDPRLQVLYQNGVDYVRDAAVEPFDIVLLDGSDPVGPSTGLFTEAFYRGCHRLLAKDGVFALQSESPILQRSTFLEIGQTLSGIFSEVHPYFGPVPIYASGSWSWTYTTHSVDHLEFDEQRMSRTEQRCKYYNRDIHRAAFTLPNDLKPIFKNGKVTIEDK